MSQKHDVDRPREILAAVKLLAAEYYRLTGKPLGVTGEVAEYVAADLLSLKLAPPRTKGFDAIRQHRRANIASRLRVGRTGKMQNQINAWEP